jgi:hypothetical protein
MLDPTSLAAAAVTVLSPYFLEAAKGAASKVGEDAYAGGKKVASWLREKLLVGDNSVQLRYIWRARISLKGRVSDTIEAL